MRRVAILLLLVLAGCAGVGGTDHPIPLSGPKILYIHSPTGAALDDLWAMNPDGSNPVRLDLPKAMLLDDGNASVQLSENGQTLIDLRGAANGAPQLFERSVTTGSERQITQMADVRSFRIAPDGGRVLVMGAHGNPDDLELVEVRSTKKRRLAYGYGVFGVGDIRGNVAYFIGALPNDNNPQLLAVDLVSGRVQALASIGFGPSGVCADSLGTVYFQAQDFVDSEFKKFIYSAPPMTSIREVQFGVQRPGVTPAGRILFTDVTDFPTFQLFAINTDGSDPQQLTFDGGMDFCPTYVKGVPTALLPH